MQRYHTFLTVIFTTLLLGGLTGVLTITATYLYLSPKLPSVDVLREAKLQVPLRIYSQNGELIGEFGEKLRSPIKMSDVPQQFINAILSAEDDRFLEHQGIDIAGLLRAAAQLFISGEIQTGGSTITMQVARNFFLSREKTFLRKFNEIFLALQIERELSKDEILELYVNKIYLGKRAYGIQAAAGIYYGQSISELDLAQLAMIAGLPKAPSAYNPINNPARARLRRDWILGRMHKLGYIDEEQLQLASNSPVTAKYHGPKLQLNAGYAAEMARAFALGKFGPAAYTDGYQVITTLDGEHQRSAQNAVEKGLISYDTRHGYRGPERRLDPSNSSEWLSILKKIAHVNGLVPAVVTSVEPAPRATDTTAGAAGESNTAGGHLVALLADGETIALFWDSEGNSLRPYINENRRGPTVSDITQLLTVGDVIRLKFDEQGQPHIAQLPAASGCLVALKPFDGAISALVGGFDFKTSKFNRVTQAYRQPGSNFKPFVYAAAMENGFTAAHVINDAPIVFADTQLESNWRPENAGGKFYGPTTLRRALYLSRNLVSVRLMRELGINKAIRYLDRFELTAGPMPKDLSLSLGSYAMTPLEVATAYATLANGGYKISPYLVSEIRDRNQRTVFSANPAVACDSCEKDRSDVLANNARRENELTTPLLLEATTDSEFEEAASLDELMTEPATTYRQAERIMDPRLVYIIDSILQDVIRRGTGIKAKVLKRADLAGKTGTTNGPTDAWFSGYHPNLVTTTWLGFDNNQLLGTREYGGSAALPIWIDFMRDALTGTPEQSRKRPPGMVSVKINRLTGLATAVNDQNTLFESFREEYAPKQDHEWSITNNGETTPLDEDLF